jgi:hypothetical protein
MRLRFIARMTWFCFRRWRLIEYRSPSPVPPAPKSADKLPSIRQSLADHRAALVRDFGRAGMHPGDVLADLGGVSAAASLASLDRSLEVRDAVMKRVAVQQALGYEVRAGLDAQCYIPTLHPAAFVEPGDPWPAQQLGSYNRQGVDRLQEMVQGLRKLLPGGFKVEAHPSPGGSDRWMYEMSVETPDRIRFTQHISGQELYNSYIAEHVVHIVDRVNRGVAELRAQRDAGAGPKQIPA